jgi:SAM-dependent methyltransferase
MNECGLYKEPELYDLLFPDAGRAAHYIDDKTRKERLVASELFYREESRKGGGRALELACGSGRMTIPIAEAGIEIVGIDLSASMLDAARAKASAARVNVQFVQGDMRSFELPQKFSTIFIAGNSLLHLLNIDDLQHCFACVRRQLAPGGRLLFDVNNPDVHKLARDSARRHPVLRVVDPKRGEVTVEEIPEYDAAAQTCHVTWFLSAPDEPDFRVLDFTLRMIFPMELLLMLRTAGFELIARYGEFSREEFVSASPRQVCICAAE